MIEIILNFSVWAKILTTCRPEGQFSGTILTFWSTLSQKAKNHA